uniref:capZ-interacting protein-like isoform X1 n=2 Tax=Pristiophorus japonicus TaxID=55135 RepID=UPI00398F72E4
MEESSGDTIQTMEEKPMSVAALASKFSHKTSNTLEKDAKQLKGPVRKKPPCSLPLCGLKINAKAETDHNGDEKPSVNDSSRHPKLKLKTSSPLIEKLQATLLLSPTALLPGVGPKSPLKSSFSPFASPVSTPDSPGARSQSSESDGGPVTFDQPTEAEPLHSLHKNRARVSLKRRPPSRRFRRSVTEDTGNSGSPETEKPANSAKKVESQQNGAAEEESDDIFTDQGVQTNDADSKNTSSPKDDSQSSPKDDSQSSPKDDSQSSPKDDSQSSPKDDSQSSPKDDSQSSPKDDSQSSPKDDSQSSPKDDSQSSPKEDSQSSPKEDSHSSSKESSPEEPAQKELNDLSSSQSQESERCSNLNQCEHIEDNNITAKKTEESSNQDSEACDSIDHNTAGSETAVSETSNQEPKFEETIDIKQQVSSAEEKSSGGTED